MRIADWRHGGTRFIDDTHPAVLWVHVHVLCNLQSCVLIVTTGKSCLVVLLRCSVRGMHGSWEAGNSSFTCRGGTKLSSRPLWIFPDGERRSGAQSLQQVSAKTGCRSAMKIVRFLLLVLCIVGAGAVGGVAAKPLRYVGHRLLRPEPDFQLRFG